MSKRGNEWRARLLVAAMVLACATATAQEKGATLRGRVVDEAGAGVFGAVVQPAQVATDTSQPRGVAARAQTDIDGNFALEGVGPGRYRLCVQKLGSELLDPCEWATPGAKANAAVEVDVSGSGEQAGIVVAVAMGELLRVAVEDPQSARTLLSKDGARRTTVLYLAVRGPQGTRRLPLLRETAEGAEYATAVPKGQDVEVFVAGVNLEIAAKAGVGDAARPVAARGNVIAISQAARTGKTAGEAHLILTLAAKAAE